MNNIAILASGSGSNAEAIVHYFSQKPDIRISCIITNNAEAGVIQRAQRLSIPIHIYSNAEMRSGTLPLAQLEQYGVDLVVLAGYLCLITAPWLERFPQRIINIHPALLPNYGGKGMYGMNVHRAVIDSKETLSGITIHLVDEHYDHGTHLLQATCPVYPTDSPESLAGRIHELEHRFYASTIEQYLAFVQCPPEQ